MLRDRALLLLLVPLLSFACSEGTEAGEDPVNATSDDDMAASDDDTAAGDDDAVTPVPDASAPEDPGPATPGEPELLIDVTTAMRDLANYTTEKEYLTETAVLEVSEEEGDPAPSLRIELPYTNYNQFIEFQYLADQLNGGVGWNLEGKIMSLRWKVEASGYANPECPGGVRMFIKTGGTYDYAGRSWISTPEASDEWQTIDFDLAAAEPGEGLTTDDIDLSDVRSIGFGFESADCGMMFPPGDPPPETDPPTTAIFYLDDIMTRNAGL